MALWVRTRERLTPGHLPPGGTQGQPLGGIGVHLGPQFPEGQGAVAVSDLPRLEVLRGRLEAVLADPDTSPRDLASVSREYRQTLSAIAELTPAAEGSPLDEITARRRKRGAS